MLNLTYSYTKEGPVYTGWLNGIDGVHAMGKNLTDLETKLLKVLSVKFDLLREDLEAERLKSDEFRTKTIEFTPA